MQAGSTALVPNQLQRHGLKERLAEALAAELGLTARRVCDLRKQERAALVSTRTGMGRRAAVRVRKRGSATNRAPCIPG